MIEKLFVLAAMVTFTSRPRLSAPVNNKACLFKFFKISFERFKKIKDLNLPRKQYDTVSFHNSI